MSVGVRGAGGRGWEQPHALLACSRATVAGSKTRSAAQLRIALPRTSCCSMLMMHLPCMTCAPCRSFNIMVEPSSGIVPPASLGSDAHVRVPSEVSLAATLTMAELGTAAGDVSVTVGDAGSGEVRKVTFSATAVSQVRTFSCEQTFMCVQVCVCVCFLP